MHEILDCAVSYLEGVDDDAIGEFVEELSCAGVPVARETREQEIYASLEWIIPTAVTLFVADKYFGTLIQEAAKSHYPVIRGAVAKLVSRISRRPEAVLALVASSPNKTSASRTHPISVYSQLRNGRAVKFIFPANVDTQSSIAAMFELLEKHHAEVADPINLDIEHALAHSRQQVVLFFDGVTSSWVLVFPDVDRTAV